MKRQIAPSLWERLTRDRLLLALLLAAVAGFAVTFILLVTRSDGEAAAQRKAESDALEAAKTASVALTTYDYRTLKQDQAWADDGATDEFAKEYRAANKPLRDLITSVQAVARGTVTEAAARYRGPKVVEVVMFVDQRITNKSNKPQSDKSRVLMTMVAQGGRWLVDDVQVR